MCNVPCELCGDFDECEVRKMPNPKGKCVYHLVVDTDQKKTFDRLYPGLLKVFLERAIKLANNDYSLFEKIFFSEVNNGNR